MTTFQPQVGFALQKPAAANSATVAVEKTPEERTERITAERFLDVLKKRPRQGTALDKVYGYHVGQFFLRLDDNRVHLLSKQDGYSD